MGSKIAWLPSRKSVLNQIGAFSMALLGPCSVGQVHCVSGAIFGGWVFQHAALASLGRFNLSSDEEQCKRLVVKYDCVYCFDISVYW
jgi:hypothetical protein